MLLASREGDKLDRAAVEMREKSQNPRVYTIGVDLESVRGFVRKMKEFGWKFDYVINNAGVMVRVLCVVLMC